MAISTTTRKVIIDGELSQTPSHCGLLTRFRFRCSGNIHSFSGVSVSLRMKRTGRLTSVSIGCSMVHSPSLFRSLLFVAISSLTGFKWLLNSYGAEGSKEVGTKPMEALKKLGHEKLKLNEYESEIV